VILQPGRSLGQATAVPKFHSTAALLAAVSQKRLCESWLLLEGICCGNRFSTVKLAGTVQDKSWRPPHWAAPLIDSERA